MHYEAMLMNPPYDKNLHLKIVEKCIPMLTDDGILVNLSPIRWLQDLLAKYKKTSDWYKFKEVRERIQDVDVITARNAYDYFDVDFEFDLGIYAIRKFVTGYNVPFKESIVDKVISLTNDTLSNHVDTNKIDGHRVRIQLMRPRRSDRDALDVSTLNRLFETCHNTLSWVYKDGYTKEGVFWGENNIVGSVQHYFVGDPLPESIPFSNETEAVNFENSTKTNFYRYLVLKMKVGSSLPVNYLPWMGDCVNPRTGLKGYEGEWTDEDFRVYFGITDSEWEEIVETMKPYL